MAKMITSEIARKCDSIVELSNIYNEWGGSFDYIHAATALVKCGKLPGGGRSSLVDKLCSTWLTQLPQADVQACANVLWASARLGPAAVQRVWGPTWEAYIQQLQRDPNVVGPFPQDLSQVFWACAKLRKQPSASELQLMVQTFLQPAVLKDARPQELANVVWALGELCQLRGWQGGVSEQDVQQLLGKQQLLLLTTGSGQGAGNVLLGLASMAAGSAPVISVELARECSKQLLALVQTQVVGWTPQHVTNAMWACGELGLANEQFFASAVAAAPKWLPQSTSLELTQAASACANLQYRDEAFLMQLLKQADALLRPRISATPAGSKSRKPLTPGNIDSMVSLCSLRVVQINLPQLAGPMRELVVECGIKQRSDTHPANIAKLWVFHSWLLQHQLLDGKGLSGVLTQQQLREGARGAAKFYGAQTSL